MQSRRKFIRAATIGVAASAAMPFLGKTAVKEEKKAGKHEPLKLGMAGYTFLNFDLPASIKMMQRVNVTNLSIKDFHLPLSSSPEKIKEVLQQLNTAGITPYAVGVIYMKSKEEVDRSFNYAKAVGDQQLEALLNERSRTYFAKDTDYPGGWEPGGEDFFSAALMEADLMRRVMKPAEFATWFHRFLPDVAKGGPTALLQPAIVTDRSDPKLVHLDGLNLSRAWCMRSIANALPANDPARKILAAAADKHAAAALAHVASGDYAGEHWLASFAVFLLSIR